MMRITFKTKIPFTLHLESSFYGAMHINFTHEPKKRQKLFPNNQTETLQLLCRTTATSKLKVDSEPNSNHESHIPRFGIRSISYRCSIGRAFYNYGNLVDQFHASRGSSRRNSARRFRRSRWRRELWMTRIPWKNWCFFGTRDAAPWHGDAVER
jgi:hypothetical protein